MLYFYSKFRTQNSTPPSLLEVTDISDFGTTICLNANNEYAL